MEVNSSRVVGFNAIAKRILAHKERYQAIEVKTRVPWYMIGVLHMRESDGDFDTYLGNGQSLHHRTTIVPVGRGPFATFEDGAVDALRIDGLTSVIDWRLEKMLFYCEAFNGWGYANRGLPSPYIWGGTNIQKPGKYIADGKFNARLWDPQPGCAPILKVLAEQDPTIQFVRES